MRGVAQVLEHYPHFREAMHAIAAIRQMRVDDDTEETTLLPKRARRYSAIQRKRRNSGMGLGLAPNYVPGANQVTLPIIRTQQEERQRKSMDRGRRRSSGRVTPSVVGTSNTSPSSSHTTGTGSRHSLPKSRARHASSPMHVGAGGASVDSGGTGFAGLAVDTSRHHVDEEGVEWATGKPPLPYSTPPAAAGGDLKAVADTRSKAQPMVNHPGHIPSPQNAQASMPAVEAGSQTRARSRSRLVPASSDGDNADVRTDRAGSEEYAASRKRSMEHARSTLRSRGVSEEDASKSLARIESQTQAREQFIAQLPDKAGRALERWHERRVLRLSGIPASSEGSNAPAFSTGSVVPSSFAQVTRMLLRKHKATQEEEVEPPAAKKWRQQRGAYARNVLKAACATADPGHTVGVVARLELLEMGMLDLTSKIDLLLTANGLRHPTAMVHGVWPQPAEFKQPTWDHIAKEEALQEELQKANSEARQLTTVERNQRKVQKRLTKRVVAAEKSLLRSRANIGDAEA